MHLIPRELAGDWRPVREDSSHTDILHLAENGDCEIASGSSLDVAIFGSEGFYVPSDRLLVLGRHRFRYDGKTLARVPGKDAYWNGARAYTKSKPTEMLWRGPADASRMINEGNTLKYEDVDMR
jgi:hypothetical protein